jgi:hypothetical protein
MSQYDITVKIRVTVEEGGGHFNKEFDTWCQRPGYDFSIFASDWPGLARYHEKRVMWNRLTQKEKNHA